MEEFLKVVSALKDETRIKLLKFLELNGECCVCDLEVSFQMLQSRLSRHLKILKDAKFLTAKRKGKWIYYSVNKNLDEFRKCALKEIKNLEIELPPLKKYCEI
jgi:ArsR family transcriptional regulator